MPWCADVGGSSAVFSCQHRAEGNRWCGLAVQSTCGDRFCFARDQDEAGKRLKDVLGFDASVPPGIVLDMPISRLTRASREEIAADVAQLRKDARHGLAVVDRGQTARATG